MSEELREVGRADQRREYAVAPDETNRRRHVRDDLTAVRRGGTADGADGQGLRRQSALPLHVRPRGTPR